MSAPWMRLLRLTPPRGDGDQTPVFFPVPMETFQPAQELVDGGTV